VLSVVVPVFDEEAVVARFHARLAPVMDATGLAWEAVYVDDGSGDRSPDVLEALRLIQPEVAVVRLSRNFGKEAALAAGLDHARASGAIILIDADLQDPPELIPALIAGWREGFDTVHAQRRDRAGESRARRAGAHGFRWLMARLGGPVPAEAGDFRLISRRAADALRQLRERHRVMQGLFGWIGFPAKAVPYDRAPRAAGRARSDHGRLLTLPAAGITGCTTLPLRLASWLGLGTAALALLYGGGVLLQALLYDNAVPGYPSLMVVVLFLGGVQLVTLGIIGEYLGRVVNETRGRPLYLAERYLPSAATGPVAAQPAELER
jgi:glycosyltransferase involved in cell wall biosynthesis